MKAIEQWEQLLTTHPSGEYAEKAKDLIATGTFRLAGSLEFIANFYCRQEIYHACAYRLELLMKKYPKDQEMQMRSRPKLAESLFKVAAEKRDKPDDVSNIYTRDFTVAQLEKRARELLSHK